MNFEDLHNELNSFPPELSYKDEYWEGALKVIKAHERKQAFKKWGLISLCAFFIGFGAFSALQSNPSQLTEYSPRETEVLTYLEKDTAQEISVNTQMTSENSAEVQVQEELINSKFEAAAFEAINEKGQDESPLENKNLTPKNNETQTRKEDKVLADLPPLQRETIPNLPIAESSPKEGEEENNLPEADRSKTDSPSKQPDFGEATATYEQQEEISNQKVTNPSEDKADVKNGIQGSTPPFKPSFAGESDNSQTGNRPSLANFISSKKPDLRLNLSDEARGTELKISTPFRMPMKFVAAKIGTMPMAEFGRTNTYYSNDLSLGIYAQRPITERLGYNIGIGGFEMSGMETPMSSAHTTYGFGFESNITTVHTEKIQFLSIPVNLTYKLGSRVQLETGLGFDYLVRSVNTLEQHVQTNSKFEMISSEETSNYFSSFNRGLVNANFGLNYWWKPRIKFGANYHLGLSDLTKNEVFNSTERDRNTRLNLNISFVIK